MNIALCHFRVGETDGVSLEMEKWKHALENMGHRVYFLAGSAGITQGYIVEELHYQHEENNKFVRNAYEQLQDYQNEQEFEEDVLDFAGRIEEKLEKFIREFEIDILVPNNIWSLGWGLPAGIAFANVANKLNIRCIAHHHDFYWERSRYSQPTCNFIKNVLEVYFPPRESNINHAVINEIAKAEMKRRKGINATVIPNVFDFNEQTWSIDEYNSDFKKQVGIGENDIVILQATRITERKAIELAIDVVGELIKPENIDKIKKRGLYDDRNFKDGKIVLVLAGLLESDIRYVELLKQKAKQKGVELLFINDRIKSSRCIENGKKYYSLWDAYVFADLITYPSILEGWGNQFLEGLFAKKPMVVYEYPVYVTDIKKKGFNIVSLGSEHTIDESGLVVVDKDLIKKAAAQCIELLTDREYRSRVVEQNFKLGKNHYSYENLAQILKALF
ncbi:MAG: mannosylglucosylglycerate synthase [Clostridiales bacterium]|nr:mannosylglucosylglycerate synthase [Clostridiales bacterium]MDK2933472.1 mannosylglucosylglycerate synthase [Clostridiales bacterium]